MSTGTITSVMESQKAQRPSWLSRHPLWGYGLLAYGITYGILFGAIIAIQREVGLMEYVESGKRLQAEVSAELLATIFAPYTPLHDGAVIIDGNNIVAAACILPLTQFPVYDPAIGTRHRAAIGLSEETDAVVVVVSEETGQISLAVGGRLEKNLSPEQLTGRLESLTQARAPA